MKLDSQNLPQHIAIIMDGNGRWAKKRGLPRTFGHRQGMAALRRTVEKVASLGIPYLTVYAFSTENWQRPESEVTYLMGLIQEYMKKEIGELERNNIRIRILGCPDPLPQGAQKAMLEAVERTENNRGTTLSVALNYGGRAELVHAAQNLAQAVLEGKLKPEEIDEEIFEEQLYTQKLPDPDLLIRTGGEMRISNFLLWQLAYTELWVTPKLWPDFKAEDLQEAIDDYRQRTRRFGKI
jgi:undecaprenyl diphosphate synthase